MGVFTRNDSPWFWLFLERPRGQRGIKERTRIRHEAATAEERRRLRGLAEDAYRVRMSELARGTYELPGARPSITFAAFADWYETNVSAHQAGATRELEILKQLRGHFGALPLADLTRASVREWMTLRHAGTDTRKGVSVATVNRELDVLKSMLREAAPAYIAASPIAGLARLKAKRDDEAEGADEEDGDVRVLSHDEERRLLEGFADPRDRVLVIAAIDTLARLSSLLRLTWRDDKGAYLVFRRPKNGKTYRVPVSTRLRAALDAMTPRDPVYVFAHRRTAPKKARSSEDERAVRAGIRRSAVKNVLSRTCARVGVPYGRAAGGVTFHSFRHTGASRMIARGADLKTVQELGGWSDIRLLMRYVHPTSQAKRHAVELIAGPGTERE